MENIGKFLEKDAKSKTFKELVLDKRTEEEIVVSITISSTFLFTPIRSYMIRAVPDSPMHAASLKDHINTEIGEENMIIYMNLYDETVDTEAGNSRELRLLVAKEGVVSRMPNLEYLLPPAK